MNRRGMTLTEVLVALFVLAIGSLSLLTLFPVAALYMQQAIKDDRAGQAAANAFSIASTWNIRDDELVRDKFYSAGGMMKTSAQDNGPSYPVYVDPLGVQVFASSTWVGGVEGIRRVQPSFLMNGNAPIDFPTAIQWFTLLDDITFDDYGSALAMTGSSVQRENRYSWAYLVKRPRCIDEGVVDVTVVVYSQRPLAPGAMVNTTETTCEAKGAAGSNSLFIAGSPSLRKGSWILDTTLETDPAQILMHGPCHGHFYRVVNTTAAVGGLQVELQTPLLANVNRIVSMQNVAEVFHKGPDWKPGRPWY